MILKKILQIKKKILKKINGKITNYLLGYVSSFVTECDWWLVGEKMQEKSSRFRM